MRRRVMDAVPSGEEKPLSSSVASTGRDFLCCWLCNKNLSSATSHLAVTRKNLAKVKPVSKQKDWETKWSRLYLPWLTSFHKQSVSYIVLATLRWISCLSHSLIFPEQRTPEDQSSGRFWAEERSVPHSKVAVLGPRVSHNRWKLVLREETEFLLCSSGLLPHLYLIIKSISTICFPFLSYAVTHTRM